MWRPKCEVCGRFFKAEPGCTSTLVWTGGTVPEPSHEVYVCKACNEKDNDPLPAPPDNGE